MRLEVPGGVWQVVDAVATLLSRAYMLAQTRAASHGSPIVRLMAAGTKPISKLSFSNARSRSSGAQRSQLSAHSRPQYRLEQRSEILQLMLLRGWSAEKAGKDFVVHPNTIRA